MTVIPAELGAYGATLCPVSWQQRTCGEASGQSMCRTLRAPWSTLTGTVWNDVDGDEMIDAGEPGLARRAVEVYGAVSGQTSGAPSARLGHHRRQRQLSRSPGCSPAVPYEVRPVADDVPAGWLMSTDPESGRDAGRRAERGEHRLLQPVVARSDAPERLEEGTEAGREAALHPRADRWVHRHRRGGFGRVRRGGRASARS